MRYEEMLSYCLKESSPPVTRTVKFMQGAFVNREKAGLESVSQELSLYHAKYCEECLKRRDRSSVAHSGGRTRDSIDDCYTP
jgi:hypothetical protein